MWMRCSPSRPTTASPAAAAADCRCVERLTLGDGSVVIGRPLERDGGPLVQAVFDQMDEETRYRRFLGAKKRLSARDSATLTADDHHAHGRGADDAGAQAAGHRGRVGRRNRRLAGPRLGRHAAGAAGARNLAMLRLFERIGAVWVTSRYDDDLPRVEQQARAPREARLVAAAAHPIPSLGHRTVRPVASGPVWTGGPASARAASACDPPMLRLQHEPVEERGIAGGIRASRGVSSGAWL
jgi:hypothetical protein